jgi:mono/diheme cytochrome c family protein
MKRLSLSFIPILMLFSLTGCSFSLAQDVTPPPGFTPEATIPPASTTSVYPLLPPDPVHGKTLYEDQCGSCHGATGKGNGSQSNSLSNPPTILADTNKAFSTSLVTWYDTITHHSTTNSMPAFSSVLDDRSRWDISAYLYMMNTSLGELQLGKEIYTDTCLDCHGETGKGNGASSQGLTLQPPDFTFESILPPRSDQDLYQIVSQGTAGVMPAYSNKLSDDEMKAVVAYIRTLSFTGVDVPLVTPTAPENPTLSAVVTPGTASPVTSTSPQSSANHIKVYGNIINDSGTALPSGLQVTLKIYDDMKENGQLVTQVNADGSYAFDQLPMSSNRIVMATIDYAGHYFNSDPSKLPTDSSGDTQPTPQEDIKLDIHIADTTTDLSTVTVDRLHVFFDFSRSDVVQVMELFMISNSGNKMIVPVQAGDGVLTYDLPANASNLQFQDSVIGERYLSTTNGFSDTATIPPGDDTLQVLFAYDLPYTGQTPISIPIQYQTNAVTVMVPTDGVKLKSSQLVDGGIKTTQSTSFHTFNGSNLVAGAKLEFSLSGQPISGSSTVGSLKLNPIWFGAITLLVVLFGIGLFFYNRKVLSVRKVKKTVTDQPDKAALMDAIIALDEQYKDGNINESAYQERRAELKENLKKLL